MTYLPKNNGSEEENTEQAEELEVRKHLFGVKAYDMTCFKIVKVGNIT